jgi:tetratricopeptide (TPR) repeat protein
MVDRLLDQADKHIGLSQYEEAIALIEQTFECEKPNTSTLMLYIFCLFELNRFKDVKAACEQILEISPLHSFEVMEIYVTALMQLKEFKQVEKIILTMKQNRIIPPEHLERFNRLQMLNSNVAEVQERQEQFEHPFEDDGANFEDTMEVEVFLNLSKEEQLMILHQFGDRNVRPYTMQLMDIIKHEKTHPFIQSLILILFMEQDISASIYVTKFGVTKLVNPKDLPLPIGTHKVYAVTQKLQEHFEQQPTTLELVQTLVSKHAIVMYPFDYLDYEVEDIVGAYIDYVRAMFGEEIEAKSEIQQFIESLEKLSELL